MFMVKTLIRDEDDKHVPYNHKGSRCPYKLILCQEGYCNDCNIYIQWCEKLLGVHGKGDTG